MITVSVGKVILDESLPWTQQPWVVATRPRLFYHQRPSTKSSTVFVVVAQSVSHVRLFATPWSAAHQASLSFTIHWVSDAIQLPNHLILCHPFLLLSLIFPSIRIFSNESVLCIRWPKYWSFSFSISPSNENSGLISLRIDFFDLFAVQGILKCLLQHSLKASVLPGSAFFLVQFSHLYMTSRKTTALIVWIFVDKMMPLLFNMLSRFVIAFLPRRKRLLGSTALKGFIFLVFSHTHLALKPNLSPVAKTFRWLPSWMCKDHLLETPSLGLLKNFPGSFQYPWNIGWSIWKSNKGLHYFFSKTVII